MSKKRQPGRPPQLRIEVVKALKDERLTTGQRMKYISILAELDGFEFKTDSAKTLEELPTAEEIFAQDADKRIRKALGDKRIREALGVKGESHASTTSENSRS
jgi:hypothetical protein